MQSELVQKTAAAAIARNAEKTAQAKHADAEHKVSSVLPALRQRRRCHHHRPPPIPIDPIAHRPHPTPTTDLAPPTSPHPIPCRCQASEAKLDEASLHIASTRQFKVKNTRTSSAKSLVATF